MDDYHSIEFLKKQFLCCTPLNKFKWPDLLIFTDLEVQKQIIDLTVNNAITLKYPIKHSYRQAFLKLLINKLEQNQIEIDDDVYNCYCSSIACSEEESSMYYRHFLFNDNDITDVISIKESTNIISQGTTGLCSWKAAFYLAEWCIRNRQEFHDKCILELGSGVGLTGLTVINFCRPKKYYFSDCHPIVLKTLEENVRLNFFKNKDKDLWMETLPYSQLQFQNQHDNDPQVEILNLKWEDINKLDTKMIKIDFVIAADILFDTTSFESLVCGLKYLLCTSINYAVIAATIRNESTITEFLKLVDKFDLSCEEETPLTLQIFVQSEETPIRIFKIFRQ